MGYKVKMQHNLEDEEIYKFGTQGNEPVAEDVSQCRVTFEEASHATQLNSGSTLSTLFGLVKKWLNDLVDRINGKQDTLTFDSTPTQNSTNPVESNGIYVGLNSKQDKLTAGENITIQNNVISSTGGGGGGGSSNLKLEFISESDYRALEEEDKIDYNTEYLITDEERERIIIIAYQLSEYSNQTPQRGTHVEDIDEDDWLTLVENPDDPVWDNCQIGYYFIWHGSGENKVLRKIAAVHYEEGNQGSYIYTNDYDSTIHLMQQNEYDEVIAEGGVPGGFTYCKDTRNLYYQDQVIVENTPPAP